MKTFLKSPSKPALLAALAACVAATAAADDDFSGALTFNKDIAPIINSKCVGCHQPGQIGPMSLMSYEEVRPWVKSIKKSVHDKKMPPWLPDAAYGKFKDDLSLTPEQHAALINWIDQGAPQGDGVAPKPPIDEKSLGWRMGQPDQIFTMLKPFKVGDEVEDHYEHVIIPSGLTEDKWVASIELKPGAADIVHHILVFIMKSDGRSVEDIQEEVREQHEEEEKTWADSKDGDPKDRERRMAERRKSLRERNEGKGKESSIMSGGLFGKYGPGTNPEVWPEGYGRLLPKGCNIVFQIHYHKTPGAGTGKTDTSSMAVRYATSPVTSPITTAWIVDPTVHLPPEQANIASISAFRFIDDGLIHGLTPHMHLRGQDFTYEATYPDGTKEILLKVPDWDFNWQFSYVLQEPKRIPKGTVIRAIAHFDNTAANPSNPDPKKDVYWGDASTDEMMIGFMDYTYNSKKKFQGQYGLPESMNVPNPFGGFGGGKNADGDKSASAGDGAKGKRQALGGGEISEESRAEMRKRLQERREKRQLRAKPADGSGAN